MRNVVIVGLVSTLLCFSFALPSLEEIDYLIEEMEYCMEIHEWYIENNYARSFTGSVEWHLRWIDTYNRTVAVLGSYRSLLSLLEGGIYLK